VQKLHTARIVDETLFLKQFLSVKETACRDCTTDTSDQDGSGRALAKIATCTNGDTSRKSSVKHNLHLKFTELNQGNVAAHESGGGNSDHSIHHNTLLLGTFSKGSIERGPVHPEEDAADHGEKLALVIATTKSFLVFKCLFLIEE
jgi:hypothetical protein